MNKTRMENLDLKNKIKSFSEQETKFEKMNKKLN